MYATCNSCNGGHTIFEDGNPQAVYAELVDDGEGGSVVQFTCPVTGQAMEKSITRNWVECLNS